VATSVAAPNRPTVQAAPAAKAVPASKPVELPKRTSVDLEEGLKKIEDIVEKMNDEMKATQRGLSFNFDRSINTHVVTVKSAESGEVIRQIPTEAVVRVAHNIEKLKGLMFDGKH
jgi:flagellar protein FlaG